MREAKFRAWDKNAYRMAEVTQIIFSKVQHTLVKYRYKTDNGKVKDETSHIDEKGHGTIVLMQYTGLKDKNGTEIYEGDILKVRFYNPNRKDGPTIWYEYLKVVYCEKLAQFVTLNKYERDSYIYPERSEVIGNIYENPELLEV